MTEPLWNHFEQTETGWKVSSVIEKTGHCHALISAENQPDGSVLMTFQNSWTNGPDVYTVRIGNP